MPLSILSVGCHTTTILYDCSTCNTTSGSWLLALLLYCLLLSEGLVVVVVVVVVACLLGEGVQYVVAHSLLAGGCSETAAAHPRQALTGA